MTQDELEKSEAVKMAKDDADKRPKQQKGRIMKVDKQLRQLINDQHKDNWKCSLLTLTSISSIHSCDLECSI